MKDIAPQLLCTNRTPDDFARFMKASLATYAERRALLVQEFAPLFERIEGAQATPADAGVSEALERFDAGAVHQIWEECLAPPLAPPGAPRAPPSAALAAVAFGMGVQ